MRISCMSGTLHFANHKRLKKNLMRGPHEILNSLGRNQCWAVVKTTKDLHKNLLQQCWSYLYCASNVRKQFSRLSYPGNKGKRVRTLTVKFTLIYLQVNRFDPQGRIQNIFWRALYSDHVISIFVKSRCVAAK